MNVFLLHANKPFSEYERYLPYASPERIAKIEGLKSEDDKTTALLSHLFARHKISEELGIPFSRVTFSYGEHGKPCTESCHFSISHCENLIAFVSHSSPIGVDIQKIETIIPPAIRFFNENEKKCIASNPERFFEIWTKKEAYIKMLGTGLSTPLSSFNVLSAPLSQLFFSTETAGFALSICAENIENVTVITENV